MNSNLMSTPCLKLAFYKRVPSETLQNVTCLLHTRILFVTHIFFCRQILPIGKSSVSSSSFICRLQAPRTTRKASVRKLLRQKCMAASFHYQKAPMYPWSILCTIPGRITLNPDRILAHAHKRVYKRAVELPAQVNNHNLRLFITSRSSSSYTMSAV